jgi:hypothetical protein
MTLHGTNPPGAKEPQGELWQEQSMGENANAQTNM